MGYGRNIRVSSLGVFSGGEFPPDGPDSNWRWTNALSDLPTVWRDLSKLCVFGEKNSYLKEKVTARGLPFIWSLMSLTTSNYRELQRAWKMTQTCQ